MSQPIQEPAEDEGVDNAPEVPTTAWVEIPDEPPVEPQLDEAAEPEPLDAADEPTATAVEPTEELGR